MPKRKNSSDTAPPETRLQLTEKKLKERMQRITRHYCDLLIEDMRDIIAETDNGMPPLSREQLHSFFGVLGIADEDMFVHMDFKEQLGAYTERLIEIRANFSTIGELMRCDSESFGRIMRIVENGNNPNAPLVRMVRKDLEERRKSDAEALHETISQKLRDIHFREFGHLVTVVERQANKLCDLMTDYPELSAQKRKRTKIAIMEVAAHLLTLLTDHLRGAPAVEDWSFKQIDGTRQLGEIRFALEQLAEGRFDEKLPQIDPAVDFPLTTAFQGSGIPVWKAVDSIRLLAGRLPKRGTSTRHMPRPTKLLNVIELCCGVGGTSLGLESSGYWFVSLLDSKAECLETIRQNRPRWPLVQSILPSEKEWPQKNRTDLSAKIKDAYPFDLPNIDLVFASPPPTPWRRKSNVRTVSSHLHKAILKIVGQYSPKAFAIECHPDILTSKHIDYRTDFELALRNAGYVFREFTLDYAKFGIPQIRSRTYLIGIRPEFEQRLRHPVLDEPIEVTIWDVIGDIVFPELDHGDFTRNASELAKAREAYLEWQKALKNKIGEQILDLSGAATDRSKQFWLEAGFPFLEGITSEHCETLHARRLSEFLGDRNNRPPLAIPLTPLIMKRLQGIPDNWKVIGEYKDQKFQLCSATPPVIAAAVGRAIHSAISGEVIDINSPNALAIRDPDKRRYNWIWSDRRDPDGFRDRVWKSAISGLKRNGNRDFLFDEEDVDLRDHPSEFKIQAKRVRITKKSATGETD